MIFKQYSDATFTRKLTSLFPGLGYAAGYKVHSSYHLWSLDHLQTRGWSIGQILQRIYKYGGQPFARDYLALHHGEKFDNAFGKGTGKAIMHATAGRWARRVKRAKVCSHALTQPSSLIGIGEIILLPLDVLKIKRQTNPEAFRGRGVFRIVADEGMGLYRGAGWTAARNAPGSFAVSPMLGPYHRAIELLDPMIRRLSCV